MVNIAGLYDENAEPAGDFSPLPAGQYLAEITESGAEEVSRHADKGTCLKLVWKITEGEFAGRLVWQRLNMWFKGDEKKPGEVSRIANGQFTSIRLAAGKGVINDTEELHFIPMLITLAVKVDKDGRYPPQNEVKSVKSANQPAPGNAFAGAMNAAPTTRFAPPSTPAQPVAPQAPAAPRAAVPAGTFSFRR